MPRSSLWIALAALLLFGSGCAVTSTEYSRSGLYAGASVIGLYPDFSDVDDIDLEDGELAFGLGIRGGYRFWDRFAVEVGYEAYNDVETDSEDVELETISATGKFYPLTGVLQPYGLIGIGVLQSEISGVDFDESDTIGRIGVGLEGYLTSWLPLFGELDYRIPEGDSSDLKFATLQFGALFRF